MNQNKLLEKLSNHCGDSLTFSPSSSYYWSPKDRVVFYQENDESEIGLWTLLHEACHGLLNHKSYQSDFELVLLEVEAWERAEQLAKTLDLVIDSDHVQDCLDSYRDWQYKRSLCPRCDLGGIQINASSYKCMFCNDTWHVSAARFCRPYRRKSA
jgi:Zn-dependent peptidase ImmA (M78 family)